MNSSQALGGDWEWVPLLRSCKLFVIRRVVGRRARRLRKAPPHKQPYTHTHQANHTHARARLDTAKERESIAVKNIEQDHGA
eukprot:COSAG01_NODE_52332_length_347_cov_0.838710_1_plen_81_part_10